MAGDYFHSVDVHIWFIQYERERVGVEINIRVVFPDRRAVYVDRYGNRVGRRRRKPHTMAEGFYQAKRYDWGKRYEKSKVMKTRHDVT